MKTCFHCFGQYGDEFFVCPHCGTIYQPEPKEQIYLDPGTMLANRYLIGESIGAGGFGVVYRAWDYKLETVVAIKEYFPTGIVTRAKGNPELIVLGKRRDEYEYRKKRFLLEARSMAKFGKHRNIPNVFEFFEANQSAYIVMELLEGIQLNDYVKDQPDGRVSVDFAVYLANVFVNDIPTIVDESRFRRRSRFPYPPSTIVILVRHEDDAVGSDRSKAVFGIVRIGEYAVVNKISVIVVRN